MTEVLITGNRAALTAGVAFGALILAWPGAVLAQSGDAISLDTIDVQGERANGPVQGYVATRSATGTKTDTPLIRTPQSISVVTRDQVEAQGAQSITQALRYTSGVAAEVRGTASRFDIPYIRGFGSPTDPVQFLDGMRLLRGGGYAFPQIDPYAIERIEFLKGPSSVLYGGSMPGGLINLVSKRPTATPQHEVQMLYGSHDRMQAAFDLSGPVLDDKTLLYRVVGLARKSDTQVVHTKEERAFIAPSFTWAPTADTTLTVSGSYQHDPEGGYYGVLPTVGSLWRSPAGPIRRSFNDGDPAFSSFDRKQAMIGYQFEHRFNDMWTLRHNIRYLDLTTATRDVTTNGLLADGHTIPRYGLGQDESIRGLTSDLQLEARFDTGWLRHKALFGFDYVHSDWRQTRKYGGAPSIDYLNPVYGIATNLLLAPITNQRQKLDQAGLYLQDQISFDRWTLVLSGRRDSVDMTTDNYLNNMRQKQKDDAYSGRIGLIYNFDSGVAPYASYSTSFLPVSGTDAGGNAFRPTTAEQYEVGVKYQPVGHNALFTLAYFDITQQNVVTALNPLVRYQNGEQRSRGVEFESKFAVTENINLIGAFTHIKAEVTRGLGADVGDAPVGVPNYTASLWADYAFGPGSLHGLKIGGGVRYVGETVGGYAPNAFVASPVRLDVPGYTLVDAMISYDFSKSYPSLKGFTAQLNVSNLFDKTYVTCLANNFCNYGFGRTVYASLNYRW
ncbi:Ferrichrysobactin receptor [Hyphomicrobiales bacterium]|nr:Ferrichrysobactin receptor [Hyphomicrobiales bacterium]CAH1701049.1 Ferrichrysobactin receptor [Hyphomicrobiales bacterium]CAI0344108.1 Ferrichrysobactin receptor [Hyphomicrobiales bacterium]